MTQQSMRQRRFADWKEAHAAAVEYARETNHDVALRAVKEYGKLGYNVSLASVNDSDYARAEIVRPTDPQMTPEHTTYERLLASDAHFPGFLKLMRQQEREPNNKPLTARVDMEQAEFDRLHRLTMDAKHAMYRAEEVIRQSDRDRVNARRKP